MVGTTALLVHEPVGKAVLRLRAVTQVPFPTQAALPPVVGHNVDISRFTLQVADRVFAHIALPDPVVDTVLGWHSARQEGGPAGGTYGCRHKEILESYPGGRDTIDTWRPNLFVSVTAGGPDALVVRENTDYICGHCCPVPASKGISDGTCR